MNAVSAHAERVWDGSILPTLADYIRIPALSPAFDPDWAAHGRIAEALALLRAWADARDIEGATVEVVGSSRVDLQACKLEYSIVSPK